MTRRRAHEPLVLVALWPDVSLPARLVQVPRVSLVRAGDVAGLERDCLRLHLDPSRLAGRTLPDEFYLHELADLDLADVDAVAAFADTFGILRRDGPRLSHALGLGGAGWPETVSAARTRLEAELQDVREVRATGELAEVDEAYAAAREAETLQRISSREAELSLAHAGVTAEVVSIEEFRAHVHELRDMSRVWQANLGVLSIDEVLARWESEHRQRPASLVEAVSDFAIMLSGGLRDLRPIVSAPDSPQPPIPLAAAVRIQMFNHVEAGAYYASCRLCGRPFVHQRGRARFGQHRSTAVDFCSVQCKNAYASREARRRKREQRAVEGEDRG